jgi:hypothetical protein
MLRNASLLVVEYIVCANFGQNKFEASFLEHMRVSCIYVVMFIFQYIVL